ncbi:DUF2946 family protein [Roseovarius nubinhibens]|uniref:DUF2946 family protein n=1 Tax=Roseovarius nubinhibens TaxID=314263 RepID=UPI0030ECED4B
MIRTVLRLLILVTLLTGVTLPKATAALASLGLSGSQTIVICTGEGLRTITLSADGTPVEQPETQDHDCLLVQAIAPPPTALPERPQPLVIARLSALAAATTHARARPLFDAPARAPPLQP